MATSSGGFWQSRFGRWLASSKNITGSVLAALALIAQAVVGLGAFWPLVVVASYAVGALLAPRERVDLRLGVGDTASAADLQDQLGILRRSLTGQASRLDDDANTVVLRILGTLDDIVSRWNDLQSAPDQTHVVQKIILDYLPTSLQNYLNLPRTFALNSRVAGKKSAHDELMEQLAILDKETDKIRDALYAQQVQTLTDQTTFLKDKFTPSSLDLSQPDPPATPPAGPLTKP
ncbi:MAG: hypothetical protein JWN80_2615 [Microbacteriaceae bacterium]|nr:hypothetical protein [Microbacteriaceae bacterium]